MNVFAVCIELEQIKSLDGLNLATFLSTVKCFDSEQRPTKRYGTSRAYCSFKFDMVVKDKVGVQGIFCYCLV